MPIARKNVACYIIYSYSQEVFYVHFIIRNSFPCRNSCRIPDIPARIDPDRIDRSYIALPRLDPPADCRIGSSHHFPRKKTQDPQEAEKGSLVRKA